jgi:hypothetical protein
MAPHNLPPASPHRFAKDARARHRNWTASTSTLSWFAHTEASVSARAPRALARDDEQASRVTPPSLLQIARSGRLARTVASGEDPLAHLGDPGGQTRDGFQR